MIPLILHFVSQQPSTLTYLTVAIPLQRAIREFAKLTHQPFDTEGEIAKQPIIISVKNAPLKDLLKRVAEVSFGHWVQHDGAIYLSFDQAKLAAERRGIRYARVKYLEKVLAGMADQLKKEGDYTIDKASKFIADERGRRVVNTVESTTIIPTQSRLAAPPLPASRVLRQALVAMGAETLADIEQNQRVVFSTQPTPMQRPLGDLGNTLLTEYLRSEEIWKKAVVLASQSQSSETGYASGPEQVTKINVTVTNQYGLVAELHVMSSPNLRGDKATEYLFGEEFDTPKVSTFRLDPPRDKNPIEISDQAKWLLAEDYGHSKIPDGLSAKLLHPDQYDPLSWAPSEFLVDVAQREGLQLVAMLPDSAFLLGGLENSKTFKTADLVALSKQDCGMDFVNVSGWLLVTPSDPALAIEQRLNRNDLAVLLRSLKPENPDNVEVLADFHAQHLGQDLALEELYRNFLFENLSSLSGGTNNPGYFRFYGALPQSQQARLLVGDHLQLRDLSQTALAALQKIAFEGVGAISYTEDESRTDRDVDPTEILSNGLEPDGFIQLKVKEEPVLNFIAQLTVDKGVQPYPMEMTAVEVGRSLGQQESNKGARNGPSFDRHYKLNYSNRRTLMFKATLGAHSTLEFKLVDHVFPDSPQKKWETLPEEFRSTAAAAQKKEKSGG